MVLATASIASDFGTAVGLVAGLIAVGGFLGHAGPVLDKAHERRIQEGTVVGGLVGGLAGVLIDVLSAIVGILGR